MFTKLRHLVFTAHLDGMRIGVSMALPGVFNHRFDKGLSKLTNALRSFPQILVPPGRHDGVVYKIPCNECAKVYVGETERAVQERMKEQEWRTQLSEAEHTHKTRH